MAKSLTDLLIQQGGDAFNTSFGNARKASADAAAAEALAGTNAQAAKAKSLADLFKSKQEADQNVNRDTTAQQTALNTGMKLRGLDPANPAQVKQFGDELSANGGSVGKDSIKFSGDKTIINNAKEDHFDARLQEGQKKGAMKAYQDAYKPIDASLEPIELMHKLVQDPSSFSDKSLQVLKARAVEGNGQRLLQSVIHSMGGNPTAFSRVEDAVNWVKSQANSTQSPEIREKLLDSMKPYAEEAEQTLASTEEKLKANHSLSFDRLNNDADHYIKAYGTTSRDRLGRIKASYAERAKAPAVVNPNPVKQGLAGLFGGAAKPAPAKDNLDSLSDADLKALYDSKR